MSFLFIIIYRQLPYLLGCLKFLDVSLGIFTENFSYLALIEADNLRYCNLTAKVVFAMEGGGIGLYNTLVPKDL